MSEGFIKKFKDWMSIEEEYDVEDEGYDAIEEEPNQEEPKLEASSSQVTRSSKVVNIHTNSQMKVVIAEPKKYDDVTVIADHLRQEEL